MFVALLRLGLYALVGLGFTQAIAAHAPCRLSGEVEKVIREAYPGGRVLGLDDLDAGDRDRFEKDHPGSCPGATRVDFYGDSEQSWALVVIGVKAAPDVAHLVMVRRVHGRWHADVLDSAKTSTPVVWRRPHGVYKSKVDNEVASLHAKHEVIVLCSYDAWSIVYAWVNGKTQKMWLSD